MILTFLLMATKRVNNNNNGGQENDDGIDADDDASYNYAPSTLLNIWRFTYATGAAMLIYVLVSRISHLTESEVWAADKLQREEERKECHNRESKQGFKPPQVGPYEKQTKNEARRENESHHHQEPVISPTMSSLTMKSEFDLLGSTNLDGCKMVSAMMVNHNDDEEDGVGNGSKKVSSDTMLLFRHYGVRLFGTRQVPF